MSCPFQISYSQIIVQKFGSKSILIMFNVYWQIMRGHIHRRVGIVYDRNVGKQSIGDGIYRGAKKIKWTLEYEYVPNPEYYPGCTTIKERAEMDLANGDADVADILWMPLVMD